MDLSAWRILKMTHRRQHRAGAESAIYDCLLSILRRRLKLQFLFASFLLHLARWTSLRYCSRDAAELEFSASCAAVNIFLVYSVLNAGDCSRYIVNWNCNMKSEVMSLSVFVLIHY